MRLLIKNGTIVTLNRKRDVLAGDLLIEGSRIAKIGKNLKAVGGDCRIVDATNQFVIPGLIQAHTHLCQVLYRGYADDMSLLTWLKKRIWPMEFSHTPETLYASSRLGLLEMQKLGTTSILDMATVRHTDSVFQAARESGMRYWGGKCLMDRKGSSGPLYEKRAPAIEETEALIEKWHRKTELLEYALCPRFAVSCSEEILLDCVELQKKYGLLIHTHASESKEEIALIRERTGKRNVDYLHALGMLNEKTVIVHGVHLSKGEIAKMVKAKAPLVHCPSSNMKLASGFAPTETYLRQKMTIGLGSDGAPCNNTMDPFMEMRLAALIQKPFFGPEAMPAQKALEMATLGGAKVLGRDKDLGSLEEGKLADIVTVDRSHPSVCTVENPYSALVYSCSGRDVKHVFIHGEHIIQDGVHQKWNEAEVITDARNGLRTLLAAHA